MVAHVLVERRAKTINQLFSYRVPKELEPQIKIGVRVKVPFGRTKVEGFVLDLSAFIKTTYQLKDIIKIVDLKPVLNKEMLALGQYISTQTLCYLIEAYQVMLPTALKAKINRKIKIKTEKYLSLAVMRDELETLKLTKRGQEIVTNLLLKPKIKKKELTNISTSAVTTLLKKGVIKETNEEIYRLEDTISNYQPITLTKEQNVVINKIKASFFQPQTFLLHGVTGSGKTEVYMELVGEVIKLGKEAIILVPEISLTPQMVRRFKSRFSNQVAILHSALSAGEKYDEWRKIERKEVSIVIGARSAIFAPLTNLGLIIIDEEHVTTYKQENHPRYHTLDITLWRSKYHSCPVLLGSATPSLESYARAQKGIYHLLTLPNRINQKSLPSITIVDLKQSIKTGHHYFSKLLIEKINNCLLKNEQVILLLNRRGYAPMVMCTMCGYIDKCPNCDITLTYHKRKNMMWCHYCDYQKPRMISCPDCHHQEIRDYGVGTERIFEQIKEFFPLAKTIRMDFDTTTRKGSHEKILTAFRTGQYNILLGTQMIAKGLDFPKVTLVGVLNGDTSLNIPDFRSSERTFQLLSQVAGRAGRDKLEGEVIIQTYHPDHYSINYVKNHDYLGFYQEEMKIRRILKYPPYYFLILVRIISSDYDLGRKASIKVGTYLREQIKGNSIILGPSTANLYRFNNNYRFQCLIKYKKEDNINQVLNNLLTHYQHNKRVSIEIDKNPLKIL